MIKSAALRPEYVFPPSAVEDLGDRLAVEHLLAKLSPQGQDILLLYHVEERTFTEIGKIVGLKYRGRELTGSAIRYHHEKIKAKLQRYRVEMGY